MRWIRRLRRFLFGDNRYDRLVIYAHRRFDRAVIVDDAYLAATAAAHAGKTNLKSALGGCPVASGEAIVLSSLLSGEERVYVLLHELGHAMDFEDPDRVTLWHMIWAAPELTTQARDFILDVEERAYELGKVVAVEAGIDIDADAWMTYVGRKLYDNIQVYSQPPDVLG